MALFDDALSFADRRELWAFLDSEQHMEATAAVIASGTSLSAGEVASQLEDWVGRGFVTTDRRSDDGSVEYRLTDAGNAYLEPRLTP